MTVRMLTADLLSMLNDLVLTASDDGGEAGCAGILLHTSRIEEGIEPGSTGALVGTVLTTVVLAPGCWSSRSSPRSCRRSRSWWR